ncbi:MAG: hypothetical protein KAJ37_01670, partial [Candidatus Krumholzibacteria bacterium]|nr:hypothetical protein [Candidatus Krumholzibacteria bacterium]
MKRTFFVACCLLAAVNTAADAGSVDLAINGYGVGLGNSKNINGLRINFIDRDVEKINGVNITLWKPKPSPNGEINGISLGIIGFDAYKITGLNVAIIGMYAEMLRGITLAGIGVESQNVRGFLFAGIAAGATTVKGISLAGIGIGAQEVTGLFVGGIGAGASDIRG